MAGTILTYLEEYGGKTLMEMPFREVDSLILCQFAYLKFDGLVPYVDHEEKPVELKALAKAPGKESLFSDERYAKVNRELFRKMAGSRRFGSMQIGDYVNLVEKDWETQFSAVTFTLEDGTVYLAFRGTDESLVGWKEDCNMALLSPIPSQHCALKYLNLMAGRIQGRMLLGGHSKGGNLAVYAAMHCSREIRDRILKIYNMDGPGFLRQVREQSAYDEIEDRIVKIIPHSSFIGMLFEQESHYKVVESKNLGLFQHNPYSWIVQEDHFAWAKDVYQSRKFMDKTINDWILSLREDQIRVFVETLFSVLEAADADDLVKLGEDKKKSMLAMVSAMKDIDETTKQGIGETLGILFEIAGDHALKEVERRVKKLEEGIKGKEQ